VAGIAYPWERPRALPAGPLASTLSSTGAVTLEPITPNPVRSDARVRYTLPAAAAVSLEIYDLQGRRIETVLRSELQAAGDHELSVVTSRWPAGCYLYRLDAGGVTLTRKVTVVR
jgi:hypothetical protein